MTEVNRTNEIIPIGCESLFDLSVIGLLLISHSGKILKGNKAAYHLFGGSLDLEGVPIKKLFYTDPPFELPKLLEAIKNDSSLGEHMLMLGTDKENAFWATIHISPVASNNKNQDTFLCQIQNVSALKQATEEVNYHNTLINELINSIPDNIFIKDKNSRFLLVNRSITLLMGACSTNELIGKTDFDFYPRKLAQKYRNDELTVMNTGKANLNIVEQVIDQDHNRLWYSTSKIPLRDSEGEVIGIMGIGKNITDLVKEKKALRKAKLAAEKADELKTAFLANLSHEVRTPLNGILGFSQFLKKTIPNDPKTSRYLEYIIRNGKRLLHLISDIVDLSKIECDQLTLSQKKFNLYELMNKLNRSLHLMLEEENKKDIKTYLEVDPEMESLFLCNDDQRIEQILHNLLSNAVKFTEKGSIHFGFSGKKNMLRFFVKDTGIGIDEKDAKQIFGRFTQVDNSLARQYEGAGLGLAIARGLVTLLKGSIGLNSIPGKGSEFYFIIPE